MLVTINKILAALGLKPITQAFIAHIVTVGLTAAAVYALPIGLSSQLNGLIVVIAGVVAHFLAPNG